MQAVGDRAFLEGLGVKFLSAWPLVVAVALALGGGWLVNATVTGKFSAKHTAQEIADAKISTIGEGFELVNTMPIVDGQRYRFAYKNDDRTYYIYVDRGAVADRDIVRIK